MPGRRLVFGLCMVFLLAGLLFCSGAVQNAQASETKVLLQQMADQSRAAQIKVLLDGKEISMDVRPVIENGRTLVPLRAIFEALGARVSWDGSTKTATAVRDGTEIRLVIDSDAALKNGEKKRLDVPARIHDGRTLVPLRFVSEALGARVDWDAAAYAVIITGAPAETQKWLTVTEHFVTPEGRIEKNAVRVPSPPKRVVVLGTYQAEIIKCLGKEDRVAAVTDSIKNLRGSWLQYVMNLPSVGSASTPDVEKIIGLKPDLVLDWAMKPEIKNQLVRAGIPVLRLYGYNSKFLLEEIQTLGLIFNSQERALIYTSYIDGHLRTVREKINSAYPGRKTDVYYETSMNDWGSVGIGSGVQPLLEMLKCKSIAEDLGLANPRVSPEWVAAKNPPVVIKSVSSGYSGVGGKGIGYEAQSNGELIALQQRIMSRPALKITGAVKHKRVYLISSELSNGPRSVVGAYYLAKLLYPEIFRDVDPEAVHREMFDKFYGRELKGIWVYPQP